MFSLISYLTMCYVNLLDDYAFYNILYDYFHVIFYLTVFCNISGAAKLVPAFRGDSCCSIFCFLCHVLQIVVCPFDHCVISPSIYILWLPLWYLQTLFIWQCSLWYVIWLCFLYNIFITTLSMLFVWLCFLQYF